jgi:hypothetical protein
MIFGDPMEHFGASTEVKNKLKEEVAINGSLFLWRYNSQK